MIQAIEAGEAEEAELPSGDELASEIERFLRDQSLNPNQTRESDMSVVKINAITVPKDRADELVARFAARAGEVSSSPGFEAFELLRPADDRDTFLVYTRWASEDDFQSWMNSAAFQHGHKAHGEQGPVSTHSELWQFDVVQHEDSARFASSAPVATLLHFHQIWGYVAIVLNAIAGVIALVAWRWSRPAASTCGSSRSSPSRR